MKALYRTLAKKIHAPVEYFEERRFRDCADADRIRELKDKFKGERCFILGNGPSLNKIDLSLLKDEYSFAVNGIFYKTREMGYRPTFFVVEDKHVIYDNIEDLRTYEAPYKFFPVRYKKLFPKSCRKNTMFVNFNEGFYWESGSHFEFPRFSPDASERVYCGQSVTIANMQLAYYFGFSEVYLIGMDFNYNIPNSANVDGNVIESTEDDINHFHPDYFGPGKKWHDPKLHNVLKCYEMCKFVYEQNGRKIINATAGGKLEVYDRVDFDTLF